MNFAKNRPEVVEVPGHNATLFIPPAGSKGGDQLGGNPQSRFQEIELLARWLDSIFKIPGSQIRFGLDALLGLIPGLGDTATSAASLYILLAAARNGVPRITILRMAANIGLDYAVGSIPLLGDVFDVFWKANLKNVELLRQHAQVDKTKLRKLQLQDWMFVGGLGFLLIALLVGSITIAYWIVGSVIQAVRSMSA